MNVLMKCCGRSLKENRRRTIVTIVGIVLAAALITAVACMVVSFRASLIAYEKKENGDYHYLFSGVKAENLKYFRNNNHIERMGLLQEVGYALLEGSQNSDKPYLYIRAADKEGMNALSLQLREGRMPENDEELLIGRHIQTNGMAALQVGDVVTLQIGSRISDGYELNQGVSYTYEEEQLVPVTEKTYTIVGVAERPNEVVEGRTAPGYSTFTCMEELPEGALQGYSMTGISSTKITPPSESNISVEKEHPYEVYVTYTRRGLRHAAQVTSGILGVSEELYERYREDRTSITEEEARQLQTVAEWVGENYWLLKWELLTFSSGIMNAMYAMSTIAVLIIIITSVFCIRNSFMISLTEKMKLYGRLSSVGTTAGQQKKLVRYEACILGGIGIPLGVICGAAASGILVNVVSGLVEDAVDIPFVFVISFPAVLFGAILSAVTIFFSSSNSAKQAAKISPISAIRANEAVKISGKALGCPKWVGRAFGVGGRIAYKNLKRARIKYRTTIVSIVVSVAAFIGLSAFTRLLAFATVFYYEDKQYQLVVGIWDNDYEDCYEKAVRTAGLEGVQEADICRTYTLQTNVNKVPLTKEAMETYLLETGKEEYIIYVRTLGEEGFARYCEKLGISVEEAGNKAIVLADYEEEYKENGRIYSSVRRIAEYRPGDVVTGRCGESEEEGEGRNIEIEVLTQTKEPPMCMSNSNLSGVVLIVSDKWIEENWLLENDGNAAYVYIKCEDAGKLEETIRRDLQFSHYTITNYEAEYRSNKSMYLLVSIFLYGFITVVALIGITNIFNTINTNMELRAPEFAMLKSVGMTGREFRRMIWLEGLFYGGKALMIGIPMGVLLSYCFHKALGQGIVTAFEFPASGVLISVAAVSVLLYAIMRYSMAKVNRRNIMETIRNENI